MCGISGIWGGAHDAEAVRSMVGAIGHRGPDDHGIYRDAQVALGMTRLSIIDTSHDAHQPMANPDETIWIVYNGEVYNFQSERRLLESLGYSFSSSSDTEVVLRLYEHFGDDFLQRLRGMFALAIYDKRRGPSHERLLLARDHFGIKPLLYARTTRGLVFASELKALMASGLIEREVDPVALRLLLTFGSISQPRTILRGVRMLPPAHSLVLEDGQERLNRFWSLNLNRRPGLRVRSYEEMVAEMSGVLEESVRLHMISDVPVGAFLSGGIDSSLLVALMSQMSAHKVKTFSVGFEAEGAALDESEEALRTARFIGTDHTPVLVRGIDVRDRIRHIAFSLDQPSTNGVNSYFIAQATSQAVKVAVSGTGGDEIFAGYAWFTSMVSEQLRAQREPWKALAKSLLSSIMSHSAFDPLMRSTGGQALWRARNAAGFLTNYSKFINYTFSPFQAARLLHPELRRLAQAGRSFAFDQREFDELRNGSTVERVTGLCLRGYMTNQLLRDVDAAAMAHSLEVRVPFLDRVVVDTALSLPEDAKLLVPKGVARSWRASYRDSGVKRILIDAGRPLLPEGFDVQPKRGFVLPFDSWLRGPLKETLLEALSPEQVRRRGLLDAREVAGVQRDFFAGRLNPYLGWAKPWLMMMIELWCREVLERPAAALACF